MLGKAAQFLAKQLTSDLSKGAAKESVQGALMNAGFGLLTGGPKAAAGYAAGDFLLNYPLIALARKIAPPVEEILLKDGVQTIRKVPSGLEKAVNFGASVASGPLTDLVTGGALYQPQTVPQTPNQQEQIEQQILQRNVINRSQGIPVAPGTMSQLDQFHYPGVTLPPEVLALLAKE